MLTSSGPTSEKSDQELLQDIKSTGNLELLGILYQRYLELVYGVCLRYLAQPVLAEDAVMSIFEELVKKIPSHEIRDFRPWLYVLVKNHCLMELRRRKKAGEESFDPSNMQSPDFKHPFIDQAPENGREAHLDECIKQLVAEQKSCISKFYLSEMTYKEIAEELGLPLGKVRSHLQNGRRNLRICVEAREKAEG